jgi:hypothetical protein
MSKFILPGKCKETGRKFGEKKGQKTLGKCLKENTCKYLPSIRVDENKDCLGDKKYPPNRGEDTKHPPSIRVDEHKDCLGDKKYPLTRVEDTKYPPTRGEDTLYPPTRVEDTNYPPQLE